MRELVPALDSWRGAVPEVALATVVRTFGSTPRPPGAALAVAPDGRMAGSVSGGCLEAEVVEQGLQTLSGAQPPRVLHYGIADELGWTVGLACGGEVDIFIARLRWDGSDPVVAALRAALSAERDAALCTVISGVDSGTRFLWDGGSVTGGEPTPELLEAVRAHLRSGAAGVETVGGKEVLVEPLVSPAQMVIVGAVDTGSALAELAKTVGYRVVVIDPRERFCTRERFPAADELLLEWPGSALRRLRLGPRDGVVCLTHDPKFDDPTLLHLLTTEVGYIGAIGSRTTQRTRRQRLREAGADPTALARIHGPVGLDLGGSSPAERALAIMAEALCVRYGRAGGQLGLG